MRDAPASVTIDAVREFLGERAARRLRAAIEPALDKKTAEAARRFVSDVPGDRIRRLRDRAAFAAAMAQLIRRDPKVRRWAMSVLADKNTLAAGSRGPRRRKANKRKVAA